MTSGKPRTREEVEKIVSKLGYFLLDQYMEGKYRIIIIQDKLGYKYNVNLKNLMNKHVPNFVDSKMPEISLENISLWLKLNVKSFELCENNKYYGTDGKLWFHCLNKECHKIFDATWHYIYSHHECPFCAGKRVSDKNRLSIIRPNIAYEWDYEKNEDTPNDVSYASHKKRFWLCPKGHKSYLAIIANRTSIGSGCPRCFSSKGEDLISELLDHKKIKHISQKCFPDCKDKISLRFDFYIKKYNVCIEYHGIQHYQPVNFSGKGKDWSKSEFEEIQKRDKIKVKYCKDNDIKILVIPYWDFDNIEEILKQVLMENAERASRAEGDKEGRDSANKRTDLLGDQSQNISQIESEFKE